MDRLTSMVVPLTFPVSVPHEIVQGTIPENDGCMDIQNRPARLLDRIAGHAGDQISEFRDFTISKIGAPSKPGAAQYVRLRQLG